MLYEDSAALGLGRFLLDNRRTRGSFICLWRFLLRGAFCLFFGIWKKMREKLKRSLGKMDFDALFGDGPDVEIVGESDVYSDVSCFVSECIIGDTCEQIFQNKNLQCQN